MDPSVEIIAASFSTSRPSAHSREQVKADADLFATPDAECLPELTCHAATEAFLLESRTARTSEWNMDRAGPRIGNATVRLPHLFATRSSGAPIDLDFRARGRESEQ